MTTTATNYSAATDANGGVLSRKTAPRVAVVDVDESIRHLLEELGAERHLQLVGAFADPIQALQVLPAHPPDVLLVDVRLVGISGIEFAQKVKTLDPDLPIIMLTVSTDGPTFFRSLMAGAKGFLTKPCTAAELMEAIDSAIQGEYVLGRIAVPYLTQLFDQFKRLTAQSKLTSREEQVLSCVFHGMSDKEIASNLGIGTATVHTHLHRLFEKLGAHSRKSIIRKFLSVTEEEEPLSEEPGQARLLPGKDPAA